MVVLVLLALAPVGWSGWTARDAALEAAALRPQEALVREAQNLSTVVAGRLDGVRAALSGWFSVWEVDAISPSMQANLLRAIWLGVGDAVVVALVDGSGRPVVEPQYLTAEEVPAGRTPATAARAAELFAHLPRPTADGVHLGAPWTPAGASAPSIPVLVVRAGGQLRLAAEISLDGLVGAFQTEAPRSLALLDGGGALVLGGGPPVWEDPDLRELLAAESALDLSAFDQGGRPLRGAVQSVPGSGWRVLTIEPAGLGAETARRIGRQTLMIAGVAALAAIGIGLALQRMFSTPLGELRAQALAIGEGRFDPASVRAPTRADELGDLGRSFHEMATRLAASRAEILAKNAEIEGFNAELQRRVDEATAELRQAQAVLVRTAEYAALGELGAGLAHELNNPLAGILAGVQVLQRRVPGERSLWQIEALTLRCRDVVDAMLRFQVDHQDEGPPELDLRAHVREAVGFVDASWRASGIRCTMASPGDAVWVKTGATVLAQLLGSWFEAVRAELPAGAAVEVRVTTDGAVALRSDHVLGDPRLGRLDDLRASSLQRWVARRLADLLGASLHEPVPGDVAEWSIRLPIAAGRAS